MVPQPSQHQCKFCIKSMLPFAERLDQLRNLNRQRHRPPSHVLDRSSDIQGRNSFRRRPPVRKAHIDLTYLVQPQLDYKFVEVYAEVNLY